MNHITSFLINLKQKIVEWLIDKEKKQYYLSKISNSTTYKSWKKYALILDELQGHNKWKKIKENKLYDFQELENITNLLKHKRKNNDVSGLIHILRNCLNKNYCNINTPALHSFSLIGTKLLIEDFLLEREKCLIYLNDLNEKEYSIIKKADFFEEAKISYGQTCLVLSGGAIFGLYHIGIVVTLMENNLLPNIICGSSVGSVISSVTCCLNYDEIYGYITRKHEEYDGPFHMKNYNDGIFTKLYKIIMRGSIHSVEVLKVYLREVLGDITFKEAYLKTGKVLNIFVSGYKEHDQNLLLNYITAPNVLVFTAAAASSAAPIMFDPAELLCKNEYGHIIPYSIKRKKFIDGSLTGDVPTGRIRELFNVTTFIVSQVNPWVFPFIDEEEDTKEYLKRNKFSFFNLLKGLIVSEVIHRLKQLQKIIPASFGRYMNLVTQRYTGDITVTPNFHFFDLLKFTTNPTASDYHRFKIQGNKRVFRKVSHIENVLRTEQLIEKINKSIKNKMNQDILQFAKTYKNEEIINEKYEKKELTDFSTFKLKASNDNFSKSHIFKKIKQINNLNGQGQMVFTSNDVYVEDGKIVDKSSRSRSHIDQNSSVNSSNMEIPTSDINFSNDENKSFISNDSQILKFEMLNRLNNSDLNMNFLNS